MSYKREKETRSSQLFSFRRRTKHNISIAANMDKSKSLKSLCIFFAFLILPIGVLGAIFTFVNECPYTVWPGISASEGCQNLDTTGFALLEGTPVQIIAPSGWSGRFWARTNCEFDENGCGSCATGDCKSGQIECKGNKAAPPVTLAEICLGIGGQDLYNVSLVDGFNLPMVVEPSGGLGICGSTGCAADLNQVCPAELKAIGGAACKSACQVFQSPEYCCKPSFYSQIFKSACPRSYSYAYDDPTSTSSCAGADYTITFCPSMPRDSEDGTTPAPESDTSGVPTFIIVIIALFSLLCGIGIACVFKPSRDKITYIWYGSITYICYGSTQYVAEESKSCNEG